MNPDTPERHSTWPRRLAIACVIALVAGGGLAAAQEVLPEDPSIDETVVDGTEGSVPEEEGEAPTAEDGTEDGTEEEATTEEPATEEGAEEEGEEGSEDPATEEAEELTAEAVEEAEADQSGPPEGTHGAVVSAAARGEVPTGCRNRGEYVSAIARGDATHCGNSTEAAPTEAPAAADVAEGEVAEQSAPARPERVAAAARGRGGPPEGRGPNR